MVWVLEQLAYPEERKVRLFAVACARRQRRLLKDERSTRAIDVAERFARGDARANELASAFHDAKAAVVDGVRADNWTAAGAAARNMAAHTARPRAYDAARGAFKDALRAVAWDITTDVTVADEETFQTDELRRLLDNDLAGQLASVRRRFLLEPLETPSAGE
jgi:hypothetical protein